MGRASRNKHQRRLSRIQIARADGTGFDEFESDLPLAALADWARDRDRLRAAGYPDRPPDVDTPERRLWFPSGVEDALRGIASGKVLDLRGPNQFPLVWRWEFGSHMVPEWTYSVDLERGEDGTMLATVKGLSVLGDRMGPEVLEAVTSEVEAMRFWSDRIAGLPGAHITSSQSGAEIGRSVATSLAEYVAQPGGTQRVGKSRGQKKSGNGRRAPQP